jgi:hypothetical protein
MAYPTRMIWSSWQRGSVAFTKQSELYVTFPTLARTKRARELPNNLTIAEKRSGRKI